MSNTPTYHNPLELGSFLASVKNSIALFWNLLFKSDSVATKIKGIGGKKAEQGHDGTVLVQSHDRYSAALDN